MHTIEPNIKKNECGRKTMMGQNLRKSHSSHEKDIQTHGGNVNKVLFSPGREKGYKK
jgi:hypothetical protein